MRWHYKDTLGTHTHVITYEGMALIEEPRNVTETPEHIALLDQAKWPVGHRIEEN